MPTEAGGSTNEPGLLIVGSGAMACLFGALLGPHRPVTLLGTWKAGIEAVAASGITLESPNGERRVSVRATFRPEACRGARVALVLVKSWQTDRAGAQLAECLAPDGVAVTLQNGLGNTDQLAKHLGAGRVTQGVVTVGATILGPGRVRFGGSGVVQLARDERLTCLRDWLEEAGFEVRWAGDLTSAVWGKLLINAGINPVTALLNVPNGEVVRQADARAVASAAVEEAARVAAAAGVRLGEDDPVQAMLEVARRTSGNRSSMLQDLDRGAPTETDAISGAIAAKGKELGLSTPVNWALWQLVRARAGRAEETTDESG